MNGHSQIEVSSSISPFNHDLVGCHFLFANQIINIININYHFYPGPMELGDECRGAEASACVLLNVIAVAVLVLSMMWVNLCSYQNENKK